MALQGDCDPFLPASAPVVRDPAISARDRPRRVGGGIAGAVGAASTTIACAARRRRSAPAPRPWRGRARESRLASSLLRRIAARAGAAWPTMRMRAAILLLHRSDLAQAVALASGKDGRAVGERDRRDRSGRRRARAAWPRRARRPRHASAPARSACGGGFGGARRCAAAAIVAPSGGGGVRRLALRHGRRLSGLAATIPRAAARCRCGGACAAGAARLSAARAPATGLALRRRRRDGGARRQRGGLLGRRAAPQRRRGVAAAAARRRRPVDACRRAAARRCIGVGAVGDEALLQLVAVDRAESRVSGASGTLAEIGIGLLAARPRDSAGCAGPCESVVLRSAGEVAVPGDRIDRVGHPEQPAERHATAASARLRVARTIAASQLRHVLAHHHCPTSPARVSCRYCARPDTEQATPAALYSPRQDEKHERTSTPRNQAPRPGRMVAQHGRNRRAQPAPGAGIPGAPVRRTAPAWPIRSISAAPSSR